MGDKVGKLVPMKLNLSVSKLNMTGSSSSHRESSLTAMSARNGPKLTPSLRDQSLIQLAFLCFVDCLEDTAAEMTEIKDSAYYIPRNLLQCRFGDMINVTECGSAVLQTRLDSNCECCVLLSDTCA